MTPGVLPSRRLVSDARISTALRGHFGNTTLATRGSRISARPMMVVVRSPPGDRPAGVVHYTPRSRGT
jgi:hypothetical protein